MLFLFEPDDDNVTLGCDFDCNRQTIHCTCNGDLIICGCNDGNEVNVCHCQGHAYCAYAPRY